MPDQKLFEICRRIDAQKNDPEKLMTAIEDLLKFLNEEQDAIKAKIRDNLGKSASVPE